tara:strand:+ start:9330 stop:9587 length:258 start_codon:yes stop_codon:yes gene_type:complete
MTKEQYVKATETTIINNLEKDCENNPMMGTIMEGTAVLLSLNSSAESCKELLLTQKDYVAYPNSEEEIDEIIKAAYKNVYDKVLL